MDQGKIYDLVVVGGGAAGYFAAITVGELTSGKAGVLILEKSSQVLGKVRISGGGRCNVTHACPEAKELTAHYPRGYRSLIGAFSRWGTQETIDWFRAQDVELKTEADGRLFPTSDDSQTVIDSLTRSARQYQIQTETSTVVGKISQEGGLFMLTTPSGEYWTRHVLIASGGTRLAASGRLPAHLGHALRPPVPSLFAFDLDDSLLTSLSGLSVEHAGLSSPASKHCSSGPLLITHRGLSGPAVLKLSAWAAPDFHERNYQFRLDVNWLVQSDPCFVEVRQAWARRTIARHSPFSEIPRRLWQYLVARAGICAETTWAHLGKKESQQLTQLLTQTPLQVIGQSTNKDEFVTCGGVPLKEINLRTMESKLAANLFFAGEVIDVDGVTGGFNFQNAWTTARHAGQAIAERVSANW